MSQQEQQDKSQYFYRVSSADFIKIPGSPIAYDLSKNAMLAFKASENLSDISNVCNGIKTGNVDLFLRAWQEISFKSIGVNTRSMKEANNSGLCWFLYHKGGEHRRWYGNVENVINWIQCGDNIKNYSPNNGVPNSRVRPENDEYYFNSGICWNSISSTYFSVRFLPEGCMFDIAGPALFANHKNEEYLILSFLMSKVAEMLMSAMNTTINILVQDIKKLPASFIKISDLDKKIITENSRQLVEVFKSDWDSYEFSWQFLRLPILEKALGNNISESYKLLRKKQGEQVIDAQKRELVNNEFFIDFFNLNNDLHPEVDVSRITLFSNPKNRYGDRFSDIELESLFQCDTIKELLSYVIGCMMGRYSMDKTGLILASQGETLQDYLNQIPNPRFIPDNDAILPLTDQEWFADDVTNRVREFVKVVWGDETLQENLAFIAESLCLHAIKPLSTKTSRGESSIETIRRYLSSQFYKDHLKTYKKRPIYWLFSSGKEKAFECLVYLHRYNESTLARMRTEYVTPLMGKYDAQQNLLQEQLNDASPTQQRELEKQLKDLAKKQTELRAFDENLKHYADMRIKLDLDDGVKVNYGKFGNLLAEVKNITGDKE